MVQVRVLRELTSDDREAVERFLRDARDEGSQLNDHLRADLAQGPRPGFVAVQTFEGERLVGWAQASTGNEGFVVDSIIRWGMRSDDDLADARLQSLYTLLEHLPAEAAITWWTHDPAVAGPIAGSLGLVPGRALLQMRRPLPLPDAEASDRDVAVRPFRVGHDEAAWLAVNNAAFAWHGEQGGWDLATLQQREHEPWFRPDGFLLHERDGRLAGFCWTKLHPGTPVVGEIYVIAVHPDFHGHGLGRALTVAGLRWLHTAGATEGMLYVDAGNHAAVRLYETLGFHTAHTDQAYTRPEGSTR
jgi:mycothiol synthase